MKSNESFTTQKNNIINGMRLLLYYDVFIKFRTLFTSYTLTTESKYRASPSGNLAGSYMPIPM